MTGSVSTSPYFLGYYMQANQAILANPTDLSVNTAWTAGFGAYYLGMVTNAFDVATGANHPLESYQVQIETAKAPVIPGAEVLWVFGGADFNFNQAWGSPGVPTALPVTSPVYPGESSKSTIDNLRQWTLGNGWSGIDFDDELSSASGVGSGFNVQNLAQLIADLDQAGRDTSYTVLAGLDFSNEGWEYNNLKNIWAEQGGAIDRVQLMLYATAMWDKPTSDKSVPSSIQAALGLGVPAEKIILGVTTNGLTSDNLQDWINSIVGGASSYSPGVRLGGLFVWPGSGQPVDAQLMQQIQAGLGTYDLGDSSADLASPQALTGVEIEPSRALQAPDAKGGRYSDIIIGDFAEASSQSRADARNVDRLTGKGSADLFVLGVSSEQFYDESGRKDIAVIKDFSLRKADRLQLSGEAQDFRLIDDVTYRGRLGTAVTTQDGDWIAFLRGGRNDLAGLSLDDPYQVVYVQ